jgi:hypothetical protein
MSRFPATPPVYPNTIFDAGEFFIQVEVMITPGDAPRDGGGGMTLDKSSISCLSATLSVTVAKIAVPAH